MATSPSSSPRRGSGNTGGASGLSKTGRCGDRVRNTRSWIVLRRRAAAPWENLARVEQPFRIEALFQAALQRDQLRRLLQRQVGRLEHAHAVLAGERAAQRHGELEQLADGSLDARFFRR